MLEDDVKQIYREKNSFLQKAKKFLFKATLYGTLTAFSWGLLPGIYSRKNEAYAQGNAVYVDDSNTTGIENGSQEHPYNTIQEGINAATAGDTVLVLPGVYSPASSEIFPIEMKNRIILNSKEGADVTILDAKRSAGVINATNLEDGVINGFTITAGDACHGGGIRCINSFLTITNNIITNNKVVTLGAGIYCSSSSPKINNNLIKNNYAGNYGGGIACFYFSSPIITNNDIIENSASGGGGVYIFSCPTQIIIHDNLITKNIAIGDRGGGISGGPATITNNIIAENSTQMEGGGIYSNTSLTRIIGNIIINNNACFGGGIFGYVSPITITNNIIANNIAYGFGGGIYLYGIAIEPSPSIITNNTIVRNRGVNGEDGIFSLGPSTIRNCIIWDNGNNQYGDGSFITYSNVEGGHEGVGNVSTDPLFTDPANNNYHLKPNSPCIDVGDPSILDPDGSRSDMGAYGGPSDTTPPYTTNIQPPKNSIEINPNTNIYLEIRDDVGVNANSLEMFVNGLKVPPSINKVGNGFSLLYNPPTDFKSNERVSVRINAKDINGNELSEEYSFNIKKIAELIINFPDKNLEAVIRSYINKPAGEITDKELAGLTELDADNKGISNLTSIEYCKNLRRLNLNTNQISNIIPLSGLTDLQYLFLGRNQISDINPLNGLTKLLFLDLYYNQINKITSLHGLTMLVKLDLQHNQISDISVLVENAGLGQGDVIILRGNPLSTESRNVYIPQLQARGVYVEANNLLPPTNQPPTADFSASVTKGVAPLNVVFDGGFSKDDGKIVKFQWDFNNDGVYDAEGVGPDYTFNKAGTYKVTLKVTDDKGTTGTKSLDIIVEQAANQQPISSFTMDKISGYAPLTVKFTNLSRDPDGGDIVKYEWDFNNDGVFEITGDISKSNPSYTFDKPGKYTIALRVTDKEGASSINQLPLDVLKPENKPPTLTAAIEPVKVKVGQIVEGTASASGDGTISTIQWDFDGDDKPDRTGNGVRYSYDKKGDYTVKVWATDNEGAVTSKTIDVLVLDILGIKGSIFSGEDKLPLRGKKIELYSFNPLYTTNPSQTTDVDENGNFKFEIANIGFTPGFIRLKEKSGKTIADWTAYYSLDDFKAEKILEQEIYVYQNRDRTDNSSLKQFVFLEKPEVHSDRVPVVLLHGLNGTSGYWGNITEKLTENGYDVWRLYYPGTQNIKDSAMPIGDAIDRIAENYSQETVNLVTHSMGGLVVRAYTIWDEDNNKKPDFYKGNISKLIMIGPPQHGSESAARIARHEPIPEAIVWLLGNNPNAPAYNDLSPGSNLIWQLNSYGINNSIEQLVIAGAKEMGILKALHNEAEKHSDGLVSISSASLLNEGIPLAIVNLDHAEEIGKTALDQWLGKDSYQIEKITALIEDFIKNGKRTDIYNTGNINTNLNLGGFQAKFYDANGKLIKDELTITSLGGKVVYPPLRRNSSSGIYYFFSDGEGLALPAGKYFIQRAGSSETIADVEIKELQTLMAEFHQTSFSAPVKLTDSSKSLTLEIPPKSLDREVYVSAIKLSPAEIAKLPKEEGVLPVLYRIGPEGAVFNPEKLPTITIYYNDDELQGADENKLKIFTYNEDKALWLPLPEPYQRNTLENRISTVIRHLSLFGLGIEKPAKEKNTQPIASLIIYPTVGKVTDIFKFDASESYDAEDKQTLQARIDFDGDGNFDTPFKPITEGFTRQYLEPRTYKVMLLVKDSSGLEDKTTKQVIVEGSEAVEPLDKQITTWGYVKENKLFQNYPNPSNPETWIPYSLAEQGNVAINIYDVSGRLVRTLDLGNQEPGIYISKQDATYWDGKNALGEDVSSGIYFYQIKTPNFTATKKMLLVK